MAKIFVNTDNISFYSCDIIKHFPDGTFTIAGLNSDDNSVCLANIPDTMPTSSEVILPVHKSINIGIFNNETQFAINNTFIIAEPGQVCVYPNMTFNPGTEALYNATTYKVVEKHADICDSDQTCVIPDDTPCLSIGGAVAIGVFIGIASVFLLSVPIYLISEECHGCHLSKTLKYLNIQASDPVSAVEAQSTELVHSVAASWEQ